MDEHRHCWHGDVMLTANPPILVLRCCWCGQEQREFMRDNLEHGPYANQESLRPL